MEIAIPLHEDFTALDAVGPNEMLGRIPGNTVRWLAHEPGPVRSDSAGLQIVADAAFEDVPHPDIVLVPGGTGTHRFLDDDRILAWLREAHEHSTWTTSVCTGSLLLAAAGILDGVDATTHWTRTEKLERLGARYVKERVVHRGKIVTGAGVSAGIDMALWVVGQVYGEDHARAVQRFMEYDPAPPYAASV